MIGAAIGKLARELAWLPACVICVWAGFWIADWVAPQGMSFGHPLADRFASAFQAGTYSTAFIVVLVIVGAAFALVDLITPGRARGIVLCFFAVAAGAYFYEAPYLDGWIDKLVPDFPGLAGRIVSLSVLCWPLIAMALSKLIPPLRAPAPTRG